MVTGNLKSATMDTWTNIGAVLTTPGHQCCWGQCGGIVSCDGGDVLRLPAMVSSGCCRCGVSAWVAARWQCSNKKQLPTHQRGSLLARNSASRAVQRSVAVPLRFPGRCLPLGKETWSYSAAVGRAGHSAVYRLGSVLVRLGRLTYLFAI